MVLLATNTANAKTQGRRGAGVLTQRQLLLLLRGQDLSQVLFSSGDEDDLWYRPRRRARPDPNRFPKVPSAEGTELMTSGAFGSTERVTSAVMLSEQQQQKALNRRLLERELGLGDRAYRQRNQALMAQSLIPTTDPEMIIRCESPVYSGQFSDDGNFFFSCVKDFKVRMYDTSNPYDWRHYKTVDYPFGRWTMTDGSLSPDNRWLAYTSIKPLVCLAPTDPNDTGDPYTLDLSGPDPNGARAQNGWRGYDEFGIFSIRFSGDGRELVAGTNASTVIVFDIESRRVLHVVQGHDDDVNAVCFADRASPHLLYSGSDDATIKVWDRRSLGDRREAGAFVGHCEGLTYIDSKGDGRYILSNGKDQCMKLWDLRMALSTAAFRERRPTRHTQNSEYDYRWGHYDDDLWFRHPDDNSLVTFRGHKVQRTLIRCHFSPPGSTDSRYVYSGSYDGSVYVWNLDATLAAKIGVRDATARMLPARYRSHSGWTTCVRDASWHPTAPLLAGEPCPGAPGAPPRARVPTDVRLQHRPRTGSTWTSAPAASTRGTTRLTTRPSPRWGVWSTISSGRWSRGPGVRGGSSTCCGGTTDMGGAERRGPKGGPERGEIAGGAPSGQEQFPVLLLPPSKQRLVSYNDTRTQARRQCRTGDHVLDLVESLRHCPIRTFDHTRHLTWVAPSTSLCKVEQYHRQGLPPRFLPHSQPAHLDTHVVYAAPTRMLFRGILEHLVSVCPIM